MSATTTRAGARLAEKLRRAVQMNEFIVQYQPIVDLKNGGVVGVQALVRWRRSDGTLVPPPEFIPIAEDLGLIVPIARIALFEAMRQTLVWQRSSPKMRCLQLHVSLSARHLRQPDMVADIADALETTDYDPAKLTVELTETALMHDARPLSARAMTAYLRSARSGTSAVGVATAALAG